MEVDIGEEENEPELTLPYKEADPLNPSPLASDSESEDVIEVEDMVELEDETVPNSSYEVGESSTSTFLQEDGDSLLPSFMRRDVNSLFGRIASLTRRVCGREMAHALVEKKGKAKDKYYGKLILDLVECKKLKKELKETRLRNTLLHMQKQRVQRDLYWTRVQAHEFYKEMIRKGVVFEERPNEAIDVPIKDEESPSSKQRGSPCFLLCHDRIMPPKSRPLTQAAIKRMITSRVNEALAADHARRVNVSGAGGSGQGGAPTDCKCTFAGFMKCKPTVFHGIEGAVELRRWFEKTKMVFEISECAEGKKVKFAAAILQGHALTWWNTKVATMGLEVVNQIPWTEMKQLMTVEFCPAEEVQKMEHELWNLKVKEFNIVAYAQRFSKMALMCPRMVKPENVKVDAYIRGLSENIKGEVTSSKPTNLSEAVRMAHKLMEQKLQARKEREIEGNKRKWENSQGGNSSRSNYKDNSRHQQNNQKQGNARAMTTALSKGNYHKYGKVGHKSRYCKEKNVATSANAQPIWTCYDCGEQGHTRNHYPKKNKPQGGNASGRAYVIKDANKQGPNVVIGAFLLNNRYASILFDSGSDKSFVNTRFSHLIDINPDKLDVSYEVELADGKVVSTNTVLRGCTLNLVNHLFEIYLMPIELVMFDVIIGMDWLVEHDAVIICGKKVVRIPCENKMLIVEGKMFVALVTKKKSKDKRIEDVPVIRDFPEVFPDYLPGLPPPMKIEFRIDLVPEATPVVRAPYRFAPSEMKELSIQLQELLEKGFIRPSSSP
ncbi:putative reverse transcriptase domain-containing protein [Tanacetum coccineum]